MTAFEQREIISATQLVRRFSAFLTELANNSLAKIAIIRNNTMEAVILPIDEYERLLTLAKAATQKSVKDFFGSLDADSAQDMEAALLDCRKVDAHEW